MTLGCLATLVEVTFPARTIPYRRTLGSDITALLLYVLFFKIAITITDHLDVPNYVPSTMSALPLAVKLIVFYVIEDFGLYWMHWLMHTRHVWRAHKWHHSPTALYWLSAVRATVPHIVLFNVAYVVALPFLYDAPPWIFYAIMVEHMGRNLWMHVNVSWRSSWIEWVIVTPRYHHVHHSADPRHHRSNLGSLLTIWDRLFSTYLDPETVAPDLTFGTGEQDQPWRLVVGV